MRTRASDNVAKTAPIGMYAVAQHMLDSELPAPVFMEAPRSCLGEDGVIVAVYSHQLDAWLNSIVVDHEHVTSSTIDGWERTAYDGRLPNGVRLSVRCTRKIAPVLSVVPS